MRRIVLSVLSVLLCLNLHAQKIAVMRFAAGGDEDCCNAKVSAKPSSVQSQPVQSRGTGTISGHEWVDLGLSVKWATCNVGAASPGDYGDYYAWGETSPKSDYFWSNLKYCLDDIERKFSKYVASSSYGSVDNKTRLELSDDAARYNWGGSWRMPTDAEWTELRTKCTWDWTTQNGHNGYKVTSKSNGNSIFLPAAGWNSGTSLSNVDFYGFYWSASLYTVSSRSAWYVFFSSVDVRREYLICRYGGFSVRPVTE